MKKLLLIVFTIISLQTFSQRIDTLPSILLLRVHGSARTVRGYVILQKQDSGCKVVDFLTIKKRKFPPRFRVQDYSLIVK